MGRLNRSPDVQTSPIEVDVSAAVPFPGTHVLRGWVCRPRQLDPSRRQVVVYCLAGGRCTSGYFDFHVAGGDGYSMAEHLARRGLIVVALDHPGVGASTSVEDIFLVTPGLVAAAHDHAFRTVVAGLAAGTLVAETPPVADIMRVGLGHSMGGMIVGVQQSRCNSFDALAVLGHGGDGLPALLTEDERSAAGAPPDTTEYRIAELARRRFFNPPTEPRRGLVPGSFFAADVPKEVRQEFMAQQTELLFTCGLTSMIPSSTAADKAAITVPLFLAFGDQDLTCDFTGSLASYRSVTDATLFILPGAAHCHNQAGGRMLLWDRIARWVVSLGE